LDLERLVNLVRLGLVASLLLVVILMRPSGQLLPETSGEGALLGLFIGLFLLQLFLAYMPWDPHYRRPLALLDVVLVTGALLWFVLTGRPLVATNSQVLYLGYPLALLLAGLRGDRTIARDVAVAVPLAYGLVLVLAVAIGNVLFLPADPTYGAFRWDVQSFRVLVLVACGVAVVVGSRLLELEHSASRIDPLTGVFNRRFLDEYLTMMVARSRRSRQPLSLLMVDLDGFKQFNDQQGHAAGDGVLREVALSLAGALREDNVVARYGGDEFVVVLPNTPGEFARHVAAELRGLFTGNISISVGVACLGPRGGSKQELLEKADEALYRAKRTGTGVAVAS
jgi:diguanylate cyclase (GGDEF)-like protein